MRAAKRIAQTLAPHALCRLSQAPYGHNDVSTSSANLHHYALSSHALPDGPADGTMPRETCSLFNVDHEVWRKKVNRTTIYTNFVLNISKRLDIQLSIMVLNLRSVGRILQFSRQEDGQGGGGEQINLAEKWFLLIRTASKKKG